MHSVDQKFSSALPIEVYIQEHDAKTRDWQKLDLGPGIFRIPENHKVMIRVRNIDNDFLKDLVVEIREIEYITALNLSENRKVTDKGLEIISALDQLADLNLSSCDISNKGLSILCQMKNLKRLNISFCNRITDEGVKVLRGLPALEFLDLQGLPKITNGSLSKIRRNNLTIHR